MNNLNELAGSPIAILISTIIIIVLTLLQTQLPSLPLVYGISAIEILAGGIGIFDLINIVILLINILNPKNKSGENF